MSTTQEFSVTGISYISGPPHPDDEQRYWAEGEAAHIVVRRSDDNEILLAIRLRGSETDDADFYMTVAEASRLAHMLGATVLNDA